MTKLQGCGKSSVPAIGEAEAKVVQRIFYLYANKQTAIRRILERPKRRGSYCANRSTFRRLQPLWVGFDREISSSTSSLPRTETAEGKALRSAADKPERRDLRSYAV